MTAYEAFEYEEPRESFEWQPELLEEEYAGEAYEALEEELAQELLEITSEEELEQFLGGLVRKVARGAKAFARSSIGKAAMGVLRGVAKTALPMAGAALGSLVAPGIGTALGSKLGSMASKLLEEEEAAVLGEVQAEYEAARRYVRWASGTIRSAMRAPYGLSPRAVARAAAISSARRYAPTLLRTYGPGYGRQVAPWRSRRRPMPQRRWAGGYVPYNAAYGDWDDSDPMAWDPAYSEEEAASLDEESLQEEELGAVAAAGLPAAGFRSTGRWYRRGGRIIVVGA